MSSAKKVNKKQETSKARAKGDEKASDITVVDTKQRLPEWMRILSDEELIKFSKYQHSVPKSTLD